MTDQLTMLRGFQARLRRQEALKSVASPATGRSGRHEQRQDIQILRGVAILSVFLFHLFPKHFPSGFIGVDLFFVVSGFLMASLYDMSKMSAGDFYLKRARRILPSYYFVILATVIAGAFLLLPHELSDVVKSAIWSLFLAENLNSWSQASYFDASYFQPLLHLWSLGVEAQFYLLFPVIAWFWRKAPWTIVAGAILSFAACVILDPVSPKTPFFLTPFRLWEFVIGIVAAHALAAWPALQNNRLKLVGCSALAVTVLFAFLRIPEDQHPGWAALALCCATAAVLIFGLPRQVMSSLPGRCLSWLGDYSYAIYLVHYPILGFTLHRAFEGGQFAAPTLTQSVTIIAGSLLGAVALHHALENRFRAASAGRYWRAQGAALVVMLAAVAVMPTVQALRFSPEQHRIFAAWADRGGYRCGKLSRVLHPSAVSCELVHGEGAPHLLVGDSYADAAKTALIAEAGEHGATVRMMSQNCAVGRSPCTVEAVLREASFRKAKNIILHASDGAMTDEAVAELARGADRAGIAVTLVETIPTWRTDVPRILYEHQKPVEAAHHALHNPSVPGFRQIAVRSAFCKTTCDLTDPDGAPLYFDSSHLTLTGARRLRSAFHDALEVGKPEGSTASPEPASPRSVTRTSGAHVSANS